MDSYQAVYDAVRSRISNGDIGGAVERALHDANISHYVEQGFRQMQEAGFEMQRPFVLLRPRMFPDGNRWCALYGDNLQEGVAGFGETPDAAGYDFDKNWREQKLPAPAHSEGQS